MPATTPRLAVQHILIRWTKASRGMPGAGRRAAVPMALPFRPPPDPPLNAPAALLLHRITAEEADGFSLREQSTAPPLAGGCGGLHFRMTPQGVTVSYRDHSGRPRRGGLLGPLFVLAAGDDGSFLINHRFVGHHQTLYQEDRFHIAFAGRIDPGIFLRPDRHPVIDRRVRLY